MCNFDFLLNIRIKYIISLIIIIIFLKLTEYVYLVRRTIPIIIWWTPFMPNGERTIDCYLNAYQCISTNNKNKKTSNNIGYIFYGSHLDQIEFPLPRKDSLWGLFHEESPKNYAPLLYEDVQSLFNLTATFSRNSDLPLTLHYLDHWENLTNIKYFKSTSFKNKLLKKQSPVLYIQSDCDTPIQRDFYISQLMEHIDIDSFGACLNNKKFPEELMSVDQFDLYNEKIMEFTSHYKFVIAFENAACDDYITEKLWRPLIVGSVPIYLGSPLIKDYLPNKNSAILVKDFKNIRDLANFIKEVNNNDTLYESFLGHKLERKVENLSLRDFIYSDIHAINQFECMVCKALHDGKILKKNINASVYHCPLPTTENNNSWISHWQIGKCQAKAILALINSGFYNLKDFNKLWRKLLKNKLC